MDKRETLKAILRDIQITNKLTSNGAIIYARGLLNNHLFRFGEKPVPIERFDQWFYPSKNDIPTFTLGFLELVWSMKKAEPK